MINCRIIAIGPRHEAELVAKIDDYQRRLERSLKLDWLLLPYSKADGEAARRSESVSIASRLKADDYVVLLDERGVELDSEVFAGKLESWSLQNKRIVFVIGGAYGVDDELRNRADFVWSLSRLVFPHQLVRLILIEQMYRATTIVANHPYHH